MKEILLAGNTGYLTEKFISETFEKYHVVLLGETSLHSGRHLTCISLAEHIAEPQEIFRGYEFEYVFYFSNYLEFHGEKEGELEQLRRILDLAKEYRDLKFFYLAGPEGQYSCETGRKMMAEAAEALCRHYSLKESVKIKIFRLQYLYSAIRPSDWLYRQFGQAENQKKLTYTEQSSQPVYFLSQEDLSELLIRVLDATEDEEDCYNVPDCFGIPIEELAGAIAGLTGGAEVVFTGEEPLQKLADDDHLLRFQYGWFPRISVMEALPGLYQEYLACKKKKPGKWDTIKKFLQSFKTVIAVLELFLGFAVVELFNFCLGNHVQFRLIDMRLLYVVVLATVHGMGIGLGASALASVSLWIAHIRMGSNWLTLFYDPANWIPFIFYFLVGAACGYIHTKNKDDIQFKTSENVILQEKFIFMRTLYRDTLSAKVNYKKQIVSSRDSFGKIFEIARKLDLVQPAEIFIQTIRIFEDVLENSTIAIYSIANNRIFARLEVLSRDASAMYSRSVVLEDYHEALETLEAGEVWTNIGLIDSYPMYMAGIRNQAGELKMIIMLKEASYQQMTLYYRNLLKILCGLVETSLLRAMDYQDAIREKQCVPGTDILTEQYFMEYVRLYHSMKVQKIGGYMLLRLDRKGLTLPEAYAKVRGIFRENDILGTDGEDNLYILLVQADKKTAPLVESRLEKIGFSCVILEQDEEDAV